MDNLPPGVSQWMLEDNHCEECENQPVGKKCICDEVMQAKADLEANIEVDEALERRAFEYNIEVRDIILEGAKI